MMHPDISLPSWSLDHVAHAVRDIESTLAFYQKTLGFPLTCREQVPDHSVEVAFINTGSCLLELLSPLKSCGPIQEFLDKHGERLHHICFQVPDIAKELSRLSHSGVQLLDRTPRPGSRAMDIAFLHPKSCHGVLIELCCPRGSLHTSPLT